MSDDAPKQYKWVKVWAVNTTADDPVAVGDKITVGNQPSEQEVVSVTMQLSKAGRPYKTILTKAL
jgi:hypothetical protein